MIPRHHFNILCVDHNEAILVDMLRTAFEASGYDVETAINGFLPFRKSEKIRNVLSW
jgi:hypothetical protein